MSSDKKNVLIVDDSMEQIDFLTEVLLENYNVISAFNGSKALELARNTPAPDLILLDIIIPAPDGYEVCSLLKSDPRTKHIPILLITGLSKKCSKEKSLLVGAEDCINKPFDIKNLNNKIKSLISS